MSDKPIDRSGLEAAIRARAGWRQADDYPESLYHYTSSAAFLNILTSGELWFTDYRYLNDLSELRYGVDLFNSALAARFEKEQGSKTTQFLSLAQTKFAESVVQTDQFVFCMCSENNLLNQWRVYGRDTVPIAIEFATRGFMFVNWEPNEFDLVPMVYEEERQRMIVNEAISAAIEYGVKHKEIFESEAIVQAFLEMFASICVEWCASMKHPQFEVEKEWRLAITWGPGPRFMRGQQFRTSPSGVILPYVSAKPNDENLGKNLPIRSLTIGPCAYPEIQKRTLQDLLYQRVMAGIDVHLSNLPIRV